MRPLVKAYRPRPSVGHQTPGELGHRAVSVTRVRWPVSPLSIAIIAPPFPVHPAMFFAPRGCEAWLVGGKRGLLASDILCCEAGIAAQGPRCHPLLLTVHVQMRGAHLSIVKSQAARMRL